MIIPVSYYVLLTALLLAAGCSLIKFRLHPAHLKLFAILLVVDLINEILATLMFPYLRSIFHLENNMIIYNSFVLLQFMVYTAYFFMIIRFKWFKGICIAFLILFPLLWIITVWYVFGIYSWNSYIHVAGSAFTIIACAVFFYQLYTGDELVSLSRNTEFWIAAALFIFYTCNLPYTGMLNYLVNNALGAAEDLGVVLRLLNIAMYSIIIYAFLCREIRTTKSL
jgi:hypothetical protein